MPWDKYYHFPLKIFNVYLLLRERESKSMSGRRAEREGDTKSQTGSRLQAINTETDTGLELRNQEIMTWTEVRRLTDWATQLPPFLL